MRASSVSGVTLLEVLLVLGILALAVVPLVDMAMSSMRVSHSAGRFIDVSLHGHAVAEALARLGVRDLPPLRATGPAILMADSGPSPAGGTPRYAEVLALFRRPPPLAMDRTVFAERLPTGEVLITVTVVWTSVVGEQRTQRKITIPVLVTPPAWE